MKKLCMLLISLAMALPLLSQEPAAAETPEPPEVAEAPEPPAAPEAVTVPEEPDYADTVILGDQLEVIETPDKTRVSLGRNEVIIIEENGDTVIVGLGSKGISIVEEDDGVQIKVLDMEEKKHSHKKNEKKFKPHWAGLQLGLNNYLTPDLSLVMPPGQEYMDLNTGKSWNWNLNIVHLGVGLGSRYVGLVSGLGFEFFNYNFDGQNNIMKDPVTGGIVEYVPPYAGYITKSKMNLTYMTAPLLLEFQIPTSAKGRIHISTGVIGGVKLWSNSKIKYTESGDKSKEKNKSDFNLSPLRWGLTAKIGYNQVYLYGTYYITPLFETGMGPELYPFSVGIGFTPH